MNRLPPSVVAGLAVVLSLTVVGGLWVWSQPETGTAPSGKGESKAKRVKKTKPHRVFPPATPPELQPVTSKGPNMVVLVLDDVGSDYIGAFGGKPRPHIDALASDGLIFRNAYTSPMCTPSRVNILTGKYARHFGLGDVVSGKTRRNAVPLEELTLAEVLGTVGYDSSAIGKWHISGQGTEDALNNPVNQGFRWFSGTIDNLGKSSDAKKLSYTRWQKNTNGKKAWTTEYATTAAVDDAIARIGVMREPWLLYVAFHASHVPLHTPPEHLLTGPPLGPDAPNADKFEAMTTALDLEVGRLLAEVDRTDTAVVLISDNGTPHHVAGNKRVKGTVYEGGVKVPMIMALPQGPKGETDALVHSVDLLPTLATLAGVEVEHAVDGEDFSNLLTDPAQAHRSYVYSEHFKPIGKGPYKKDRRAVRNARYKLIRTTKGEFLYDLKTDPGEETNLIGDGDLASVRSELTSFLDDQPW